MVLDDKILDTVLHRGVSEIVVEEEFVALLKAGRPLRLKMGFDPSSADIHIGHAVGLRKLRQFQDLGHQVVLIVGDWTARIGDPSGMSATRRMLTQEEVEANAETYMRQFFKVVDKSKTQAVYQSEWYGNFSLEQVIRLTSKFTVAQFLAREDFARRYREGRPIAITELLYPLLQAYDSVAIRSDVEFGGMDQKFNLLVGRELQTHEGQRPQQCFLVPLLVGTDGSQKMSKSLGNYIGVDDPPNDMYGKVMSVRDDLIAEYFNLVTDVDSSEIAEMRRALADESVNPMDLKKRLAREIVGQFHDAQATREAEANFERVVQRGEVPEEMAVVSMSKIVEEFGARVKVGRPNRRWVKWYLSEVPIVELLVSNGLVTSKGAAKRLLRDHAIKVDDVTVETDTVLLVEGNVIRVGKRRYLRIVE